ncbi:hypothetical protein SPF06_07845 [Sinomonas sp. JGH33]|uniref:Uncharacterized protein n=1 Tax=Sinomonas terricola TaxID=3110330 RepID=A0ABU5T522_9MICC|nr:hypothetical protein [Sinomonas sp. JGH33]MEA5454632.1 hypothetical protein [Sinomonas sp. JGH33]
MIARVVLSALGGLFVGASVLVVGLAASVAFAWATGTRAYLPGVFEAWFTEENGMPAVNFIPNQWGMLAVVLGVAALVVVASVRRRSAGRAE